MTLMYLIFKYVQSIEVPAAAPQLWTYAIVYGQNEKVLLWVVFVAPKWSSYQWPLQEPKIGVSTIYKAYVRAM